MAYKSFILTVSLDLTHNVRSQVTTGWLYLSSFFTVYSLGLVFILVIPLQIWWSMSEGDFTLDVYIIPLMVVPLSAKRG